MGYANAMSSIFFAALGQSMQYISRWEDYKYFFQPKMYHIFQGFFKNHEPEPQMYPFRNKTHIEYKQNSLRYMYISFVWA